MTHLVLAVLIVGSLYLLGCSSTPTRTAPVPVSAAASTPAAWGPHTPVGEIVAAQPDAARIFELVGIDYCCGGATPLTEAADAAGVSVTRLLSALSAVGRSHIGERNWREASVDELIDHIVNTYHAQLREELPRLQELIALVKRVHGADHPELADVQQTFLSLRSEMEEHLKAEEQTAFPAFRQLAAGQSPADVDAMLILLVDDHEEAGRALQTIHQLTNGYIPPAGACAAYQEMLRALDRLERQTLAHIHLENNILFPQARHLLAEMGH